MSEHPLPLKLGLLPLALYLLLAAGAAIVVPSDYGGDPRPTPPDEGPHLGYVEHLANQRSLPVFLSLQDNYEGHQPPLYYVSCLPAYLLARAAAPGETGGLSRAGLVLVRLWSVLLGGIGVWALWLVGRLVFSPPFIAAEKPRLAWLALAPAVFLALWPGRTMIISAITNDGLAEGMCLVAFYLVLRALVRPPTLRDILWLGLAFSAALLSKSTSLALAPVILLGLVMAHQRHARQEDGPPVKTPLLTQLGLLAAIVAVLTGWWFVRNQMWYGDPLAAGVFERLFSKDRPTPEYFLSRGMSGGAYFLLVVINTALSFWGVYGQANVYSPEWYYLVGGLIWVVALAGIVKQGLANRLAPPPEPAPEPVRKKGKQAPVKGQPAPDGEEDWRRGAFVLAWVLLVIVVAFFLRFNTSFYQAQARYLFAASGPIWLLATLGLWDLHRRRYGLLAVGVAAALMLMLSLWSVLGFPHLVAAHYLPPFFGG